MHLYFWEGDILVLYALMGFCLIPFRRVSDRTLLRTATALVFAPVLLEAIIVATHGALDPGAPLLRAGDAVLVATGFPAGAAPYPVLRDAGWAEYLRFQLSGVFFRYADLLSTGRPFKVLAMFLVGLWVRTIGHADRPDAVAADTAAGSHVVLRHRTTGGGDACDVDARRGGR